MGEEFIESSLLALCSNQGPPGGGWGYTESIVLPIFFDPATMCRSGSDGMKFDAQDCKWEEVSSSSGSDDDGGSSSSEAEESSSSSDDGDSSGSAEDDSEDDFPSRCFASYSEAQNEYYELYGFCALDEGGVSGYRVDFTEYGWCILGECLSSSSSEDDGVSSSGNASTGICSEVAGDLSVRLAEMIMDCDRNGYTNDLTIAPIDDFFCITGECSTKSSSGGVSSGDGSSSSGGGSSSSYFFVPPGKIFYGGGSCRYACRDWSYSVPPISEIGVIATLRSGNYPTVVTDACSSSYFYGYCGYENCFQIFETSYRNLCEQYYCLYNPSFCSSSSSGNIPGSSIGGSSSSSNVSSCSSGVSSSSSVQDVYDFCKENPANYFCTGEDNSSGSGSAGNSSSSKSEAASSSSQETTAKHNEPGPNAVYTADDIFSSGLDNMESGKCYSLNPDRGTQYGWINNNAQDSWWWIERPCDGSVPVEPVTPNGCKSNKRGENAVYTADDCFSDGLDNMEHGKCYGLNPDRGTQYGWISNDAGDSWWWVEKPCGWNFFQKRYMSENDTENFPAEENKSGPFYDAKGRKTAAHPETRRFLFLSK